RYFAYGSNMDVEQMRSRVDTARFAGVARLEGYRMLFNKAGGDRSAKANILSSSVEGAFDVGCIYELSDAAFQKLKSFEPGYVAVPVEVDQNGAKVQSLAFIAEASALMCGAPNDEYFATILRGATRLELPKEYIASLQHDAIR